MNTRAVATGAIVIVLAGAFFLFMLAQAAKSNDPGSLMQTVGALSGAVGGIGLAMVVFGVLRRPR